MGEPVQARLFSERKLNLVEILALWEAPLTRAPPMYTLHLVVFCLIEPKLLG